MEKGDKILVTGGAGFIGSHLCELLIEKGYNVFSLDNYFTGTNLNHVKGVIYIKGDCENIDKHINFSPILIFHLGEYSRVEQSFEDLEKVIKYNIISFYEVIRLCQYFNAKLIYCGSSTKFARYDKNDEISPYAWSKKNNTEFLINFGKLLNIKYAITYFYNVYGEREISEGKYSTVIAKFTKQKKSKKKYLSITKPGTQRRNFTHVEDVISGLLLVAQKGVGDGYGIASPKSYSIIELAKLFDMKYRLQKKKKGNRLNGKVNIEKTKKLGWSAKLNLKDFIEKQI